MNEVSVNSGVVQVPTITGSEQAQPLVAPEQIIQKDGYLYIYVSNESAQKVYFNNLVIHHNRGPILQADSYHPFGLTMAGISDHAALSLVNKFLYNGKELQHHEFSDNSGLDWYDYGARMYDAQIGRWGVIDPHNNKYFSSSPYDYVLNNPINAVDPFGMDTYLSGESAQDFFRWLQRKYNNKPVNSWRSSFNINNIDNQAQSVMNDYGGESDENFTIKGILPVYQSVTPSIYGHTIYAQTVQKYNLVTGND